MVRRSLSYVVPLALAVALVLPAAASAKKLDEGLLDPAWFGGELEFHKTDEIDYLWVKEGFSLDGRTVRVADWEEPEFLSEDEPDSKDRARAFQLTEQMPSLLRGGISGRGGGTFGKDDGDLVLVGRFVDVNAGSKVAKWLVGMGAGAATATWDLKIVDAESGELLAAIHHRAVSGTNMSDIDDKVIKWIDEGLGEALDDGLAAVYADGKKAKK